MRIVTLSDTHTRHHKLTVPPGDLLIHAGDMSNNGTAKEVEDCLDWFGTQALRFDRAILIAGNHDWLFQTNPEYIQEILPPQVTYLENTGTTYQGLNIWGSPVVPAFGHYAFNQARGTQIKAYWDSIPLNTDILITHTPAHGYLDALPNGARVGCEELSLALARVQPRVHICGHIHSSAGVIERHLGSSGAVCTIANVCQLNDFHRVVHNPFVIDIDF